MKKIIPYLTVLILLGAVVSVQAVNMRDSVQPPSNNINPNINNGINGEVRNPNMQDPTQQNTGRDNLQNPNNGLNDPNDLNNRNNMENNFGNSNVERNGNDENTLDNTNRDNITPGVAAPTSTYSPDSHY